MNTYQNIIEQIWANKDSLSNKDAYYQESKEHILKTIELLDQGKIYASYKEDNQWHANEWVKKAILLYFKISDNQLYDADFTVWRDKVKMKFSSTDEQYLNDHNIRTVPGSYIRLGSYIGPNTVIMPSFINIGAHVGEGTLIDTWATVGSCAYIGKNCHISGGTGIGGVLEPLQATPVIIEDNCFIGARSEIAEGVVVEEGSVISMGVYIGASTKIVNRQTGEITYGKIPAYSVVVPGSIPGSIPSLNPSTISKDKCNKEQGATPIYNRQATSNDVTVKNGNWYNLPSLYCAVIIKQVDAKTRSKTSINELLR